MSDKKQQQHCVRAEERKNQVDNCDDDKMVFPDEKEKPSSFDTRNFANSNTNPGYGTDANGDAVPEFN